MPTKSDSTKKSQIIEQWKHGQQDIWKLAEKVESRPSYVATVLQNEGLLRGYFDLYTSLGSQEMNIYSPLLKGRLGYRDIPAALESVQALDEMYQKFEAAGDKAGQHHALVTALTLFDRARWSGKKEEAKVLRHWLIGHMNEVDEGTEPH